jgi:hypothetical protein
MPTMPSIVARSPSSMDKLLRLSYGIQSRMLCCFLLSDNATNRSSGTYEAVVENHASNTAPHSVPGDSSEDSHVRAVSTATTVPRTFRQTMASPDAKLYKIPAVVEMARLNTFSELPPLLSDDDLDDVYIPPAPSSSVSAVLLLLRLLD